MFLITKLHFVGLAFGVLRGGVFPVGGSRVEVEFRRLTGGVTTEADRLAATAHVEAVKPAEFIGLAVNGHRTGTTKVKHAEFPALQEILRPQVIIVGQIQCLTGRDGHSENKSVVVRVDQFYFAFLVNIVREKLITGFIGREGFEVVKVDAVAGSHS